MTRRPFPFTGRIRSVKHAVTGIGMMLRTQRNAWVHAVATAAVVAAGLVLGIGASGWCWLVLATCPSGRRRS